MDINAVFGLAPIAATAGAAIAVMIGIAIRRHFAQACIIAACGIIVSLLALAYTWGGSPVQATLLMRVDGYAQFFMALLLSAGLAVLGLCYDYFKGREGENEELPLLLLTALLGALVMVGSSHFASFFMGLETLGISLFVLIGYPENRALPLEAAIKYLVLSGVSSTFLLMGMALIYAQCGKLDFGGIGNYLSNQSDLSMMILGGIILIVAGLGFKLSLIPFHLWTPDVYQGAPAPVTAFIATVSKGAVFALLLRFFLSTDSYAYAPLHGVLSVMAGLSILGGNLLALLQNNVKRILAYSSIAHMGYLLVAFIAAGSLVAEAVGFYLLAYFITTIGAFGIVSSLSTPQTEADDLAFYRGLFWRRPWTAAVFTLMLLSLAGIPLTVGFIGKFYVFLNAAEGGLWALLFVTIVGSGLGLYYYLRIIVVMSVNDEEAAIQSGESDNDWISASTLAVLTILLIGLGIYPGLLANVIQSLTFTMK